SSPLYCRQSAWTRKIPQNLSRASSLSLISTLTTTSPCSTLTRGNRSPPTCFSTGSSTATTSPSFPWISSNPSKDLLIPKRRTRSLLLPDEFLLRLS
ncbi:unnamed protein product, partial [Brassica rapa subsp. narinosa]